MIAKASTISHGANAIRYSVNKERADLVKVNLLPNDISPEAVYGRMMLVQKKFTDRINKGRPLDRNVIRIEISPSEEESRGWAMDDWARLADEFIRVFDSIDFSHKTGRQPRSGRISKARNTSSPCTGMPKVAFSICTSMPTV